mmetsp:Transcript_20923/g.43647  ORF Transcript_20923/g.43647 Transcript_20923/m.43647 type:complete len:241 (-) Transcript_20923:664-1386(-)
MLIKEALLRLKLSKTPKLITFHKMLTGQANAKATRAINPVNANPQTKVPSLLCLRNMDGISLSVAIVAETSGWGKMLKSTTSGSRISSPKHTIHETTVQPLSAKAVPKSLDLPGSEIKEMANCAVKDTTAAMPNVPMSANGMVRDAFLALEDKQQTSSKPMKPKKSSVVALTTPEIPPGAKTSPDSKIFCEAPRKPQITMKITRRTFIKVMRFTTALLRDKPPIKSNVQPAVRKAADKSM